MLKKTGGRGKYSHVNSKGVRYYLNVKEVVLRGDRRQSIYYFTKDFHPETSTDCPGNFGIRENPRNGFLTVITPAMRESARRAESERVVEND
jgi:hypothetical protein